MLEENQKFTIRIELPDGYFVNVVDNFNYLSYLYLLFPIISLVIVIVYWWKYARNNKFNQEITSDIPNNFDPVEIAYLYKGSIQETDIATDILFLANNGYLNIEENEDGYKLGIENTFKFIKNKEYDKNNAIQKLLFEGIFKDKDLVELKDIEYSYSSKIIDTRKMIDNKDNKLKVFNININTVKKVSLISLFISIFALNIEPIKQLMNSYLLVPIVALLMFFALAVIFIFNIDKFVKKLFGIILFIGIVGISVYTLLGQTQLLIIYILCVLLVLISIFIYRKIPNRTIYGNKKLAEISAFKIGLLSMSINDIKENMEKNSNYFYDMIPYAIVLGIVDDWYLKGKPIVKEPPSWHMTQENFDLQKEIKFFNNVIYTTSKVMIKAIYAKKDSSQIEYKIFKR